MAAPLRSSAARQAALVIWMSQNEDVSFDERPRVLHVEDGNRAGYAWVQAWLLVPAEAIDERLKATS